MKCCFINRVSCIRSPLGWELRLSFSLQSSQRCLEKGQSKNKRALSSIHKEQLVFCKIPNGASLDFVGSLSWMALCKQVAILGLQAGNHSTLWFSVAEMGFLVASHAEAKLKHPDFDKVHYPSVLNSNRYSDTQNRVPDMPSAGRDRDQFPSWIILLTVRDWVPVVRGTEWPNCSTILPLCNQGSYHERVSCPFPICFLMYSNASSFLLNYMLPSFESSMLAVASHKLFPFKYLSLIQSAHKEFELHSLQTSLCPPAEHKSDILLHAACLLWSADVYPTPSMYSIFPEEICTNSF